MTLEERYRSAIQELAIRLAHELLPAAHGVELVAAATEIAASTYRQHGLPVAVVSQQASAAGGDDA